MKNSESGRLSAGVRQIPSTPDMLTVTATLPDCPPAALFDYWVVPELSCRWWPPVVTVEPRVGGSYHLAWPSMDWHLRGNFTAFFPGEQLGFTWRWDHDPVDQPMRDVAVAFVRSATVARASLSPTATTPPPQKTRRSVGGTWKAGLPS